MPEENENQTGGDLENQNQSGTGGGEGGGTEGQNGEGVGTGSGTGVGASSGLSKDDITEILANAGFGREEQPRNEEKTYTEAEIKQLLNVWEPGEDLVAKLKAEDPKAAHAVLLAIRDGIIKQANTMSEARLTQIIKQIRDEEIAPLRAHYEEAAAQRDQLEFEKKYPELKDYPEIVDAVTAKLRSSGFKAATKAKVFEEIAKNTREVLKRSGIEVKVAGGAAGGNGSTRMSSLTSGGGQRGGSPAGGKNRLKGMDVFDESVEA